MEYEGGQFLHFDSNQYHLPCFADDIAFVIALPLSLQPLALALPLPLPFPLPLSLPSLGILFGRVSYCVAFPGGHVCFHLLAELKHHMPASTWVQTTLHDPHGV